MSDALQTDALALEQDKIRRSSEIRAKSAARFLRGSKYGDCLPDHIRATTVDLPHRDAAKRGAPENRPMLGEDDRIHVEFPAKLAILWFAKPPMTVERNRNEREYEYSWVHLH